MTSSIPTTNSSAANPMELEQLVNQNQATGISDLPEEMIIEIFKNLSGRDLGKFVSLGSTQLRRIALDPRFAQSRILETFEYIQDNLTSNNILTLIYNPRSRQEAIVDSAPRYMCSQVKELPADSMGPVPAHINLVNDRRLFQRLENLLINSYLVNHRLVAVNPLKYREELFPTIKDLYHRITSSSPELLKRDPPLTLDRFQRDLMLYNESNPPSLWKEKITKLFFKYYSKNEIILNVFYDYCGVKNKIKLEGSPEEALKSFLEFLKNNNFDQILTHSESEYKRFKIRIDQDIEFSIRGLEVLFFLDKGFFLETSKSIFESLKNLIPNYQENSYDHRSLETLVNLLVIRLLNPQLNFEKNNLIKYITKHFNSLLNATTMATIYNSMEREERLTSEDRNDVIQNLSPNPLSLSLLSNLNFENYKDKIQFVKTILTSTTPYKAWVNPDHENHLCHSRQVNQQCGMDLIKLLKPVSQSNQRGEQEKSLFLELIEPMASIFPHSVISLLSTKKIRKEYGLDGLSVERIQGIAMRILEQTTFSKEFIKFINSNQIHIPNTPAHLTGSTRDADAIDYFKFNQNLPQELVTKETALQMFEKMLNSPKAYKTLKLAVEYFLDFNKDHKLFDEKELDDIVKKIIDVHGFLAHRYFKKFTNDQEKIAEYYRYIIATRPHECAKIIGKANNHNVIFEENLTHEATRKEIHNECEKAIKNNSILKRQNSKNKKTPAAKRQKPNPDHTN